MSDSRAPLVHRSITDQVTAQLRDEILSGRFTAGQRLTQSGLANELGVSTMPVREAMLRLATEGLITAEPNRSFRVASNSEAEVRDMYWLHATISGELAQRAAARSNPALVQALTEFHRNYLKVIDRPDERFAPNWQFFGAINSAANAPRLVLMLTVTLRYFPDILRGGFPGSGELAGRWQRDLLRAITKGDGEQAKATSEKYARRAGELYIKTLRSSS